jgi:hypothetical protein
MKKFTMEELVKSEKGDLHVRLPAVLDKMLKDDANKNSARNKSFALTKVVASYYGVLADD